MKNKVYIISPSALSYKCNHCEYLKHHYNLENRGVPVGVTQTLDNKEKEFFIKQGTKAIDGIPKGKIIDPGSRTFSSIKFLDLKGREFRIRGKGDGIIKFDDGTSGIIDYKTSKFKKNDTKDYSFKDKDLDKKITEYTPQLHAYAMLYENLEINKDFLRKEYKIWYKKIFKKTPLLFTIDKGVYKKELEAKNLTIKNIKLLGLVFVYPEYSAPLTNGGDQIGVSFSYRFYKIPIDMQRFLKMITDHIDMLEKNDPPEPPSDCGAKNCGMHRFFYDKKKLKKKVNKPSI